MNEIVDVALLVDLSWLQLVHPPPGGCHGVRVEGAERPGEGRGDVALIVCSVFNLLLVISALRFTQVYL